MKLLYGISSIKKEIQSLRPLKTVLVIARRVAKVQPKLVREIRSACDADVEMIVDDGENLKSWKSTEAILKKFSAYELDRDSLIIAVGGGTVGDAVGFASSIYLRGIRYVNVPTTLLAQVDSAHGGKTGINFGAYKNQVGTFHESAATVVDHRFIKTLPTEEVVSGLGEIIKAGFISDASILTLLEKERIATFARSRHLDEIIRKSIEVKRTFVNEDLHDRGLRQILNVGHTIGHAIELKHDLSHGRAVIIGMIKEFEMGERAGLLGFGLKKELVRLLEKMHVDIFTTYIPDWKAVWKDKKVSGDMIVWPIVEHLGKATLVKISKKKFKKLFGYTLRKL